MSTSAWPTRIVVVLATYTGTPSMPDPIRGSKWRKLHSPVAWWYNTSNLTFVTYQRQNASLPNYSPNYGFEAGVIVQFVVEHFDNLPDITIFMQDRPEQHNPHWLAWTECLRPNVTYAPMTNARMSRLMRANAQTDRGTEADDAIVEQCWRNMLDAFNSPLLLPREQPFVSYFQGSTFAVSRDRLRATSRERWKRAHGMIAGGDGTCHHGTVEWELLSVVRRRSSRVVETSEQRGKHTSANAFEALQHILVGGMSAQDVFTYDYCKVFVPDCPRTPCGRVRPAPKYHKQMTDRVEIERRRLRREYGRLVRGLRTVAGASDNETGQVPHDLGTTRMERAFWREFGWMLGQHGHRRAG